MSENNDKIRQMQDRLDKLASQHQTLSDDIRAARSEISRLTLSKEKESTDVVVPVVQAQVIVAAEKIKSEKNAEDKPSQSSHIFSDLEKFIGENLINKIGIAITVIGVSIGAKYAIDHDLINPLTRIILAYLVGLGLLLFAIKLKRDYLNFSAVLLSGAMAIMYFITYLAFSFYSIYSQGLTFALMVLITGFTVTAAITYNKQVIAHIGLVGAYAVPFLLNQGPENFVILFSYTAIINIGILVISFKKYWKPLYYSSFILTWLMFMSWYGQEYNTSEHLIIASVFMSIFFVTFYLMFLAYKLLQKEKFDLLDVVLVLANSFIFYGIGYNILKNHDSGEHFLGLFTVFNAVIHSIVSIYIYRQKLGDRNLFYLVSGLVLIFITIAIPVQLNGNWVTLLWSGEAALLFWIGRTNKVQFYEILSYFLIYLSFFSILYEWSPANTIFDPQDVNTSLVPFLNINFLTSILFIVSVGFIIRLNRNPVYPSPLLSQKELLNLLSLTISAIFLISLYMSFYIEISKYWDNLYNNSLIEVNTGDNFNPVQYRNTDLDGFRKVWLLNYSLLFFSVWSFVNIMKIKSREWAYANLASNAIVLILFLTQGLYILSELRESYLNPSLHEYYQSGVFNIGIRYVSFVFAGLMLVSLNSYKDKEFLKPQIFNLTIASDLIIALSVIWIISSELISWMDIMKSGQSYKLGLSILWGVSSLFLIGIGIWKNKKHLRIAAIFLFAVTLIKLFFYDITHLDTIAKTIVFVTLGILLLIISFLYNKYKKIIF